MSSPQEERLALCVAIAILFSRSCNQGCMIEREKAIVINMLLLVEVLTFFLPLYRSCSGSRGTSKEENKVFRSVA